MIHFSHWIFSNDLRILCKHVHLLKQIIINGMKLYRKILKIIYQNIE